MLMNFKNYKHCGWTWKSVTFSRCSDMRRHTFMYKDSNISIKYVIFLLNVHFDVDSSSE